MKKFLSLALAFTVSSLGLVSLLAQPVHAQQVASAGKSIAEIKEEYERLLAVDRDPSTPAEVREINQQFLEKRRTQLRTAIEGRLGALRKYQTSLGAALSAEESLVVGNSIQALEKDLSALSGGPQASTAITTATTQRARLIKATAHTSSPISSSLPPVSDNLSNPPAAPNAVSPPSPLPAPPLNVNLLSPAVTGTTFDTSEIKVEIAPTTAINQVEVKVENGGKAVGSAKTINWSATDVLPALKAKSIVVGLAAGDNDITVTVTNPASTYDPKKTTVKYAAPTVSTVAAAPASATAPPAPSVTLDRPTLNQPKEDQEEITGTVARASKTAEVEVTIDGNVQSPKASINNDGSFTYTNSSLIIRRGQRIRVRQMDGNNVSPFEEKTVIAAGQDRNLAYEGAPTGLVFGGAVMSQQAQEFQQADPFFGFIAGYRFPVLGKKKTYVYDEVYDADNTPLCNNPDNLRTIRAGNPTCRLIPKKINGIQQYTGGIGRFHLRFQGIFTASPRAATPGASPTPTGTPVDVTDFKPFIASRKAFETEVHGWFDVPLAQDFFIGPYGAWGASTVLSKNELSGEKIAVEPTNSNGNQGSNPNNPTIDGSQVQTDNDIKQYKELGLHMSSLLFSRKVFLETIVAHGWYEGLQGLYAGHDTRKRFIGKLRIFPSGLSTTFGEQLKMAPMFGVDLNAGRGPDQIRFFTGFAVRIRGLQ